MLRPLGGFSHSSMATQACWFASTAGTASGARTQRLVQEVHAAGLTASTSVKLSCSDSSCKDLNISEPPKARIVN